MWFPRSKNKGWKLILNVCNILIQLNSSFEIDYFILFFNQRNLHLTTLTNCQTLSTYLFVRKIHILEIFLIKTMSKTKINRSHIGSILNKFLFIYMRINALLITIKLSSFLIIWNLWKSCFAFSTFIKPLFWTYSQSAEQFAKNFKKLLQYR